MKMKYKIAMLLLFILVILSPMYSSDADINQQNPNQIKIIKAEHLNENKEFISNIYNKVNSLDDIWSETIRSEHYVRVTFEQNLTSNNDITLYPRIISGTPRIEVYEINTNELIAEFTSLQDEEYNKIFLDGSTGAGLEDRSQNTFDLRILGGKIQINHIIDPNISFSNEPTVDISVAALDNRTFVLAMASASNITFRVYDTNGTNLTGLIGVPAVATGAGSRVSVGAINSSTFAVVWFNAVSTVQDTTYSVFDRTGTKITGPTDLDATVGTVGDPGRPIVMSNSTGSFLQFCYSDQAESDADVRIVPINGWGAGTESPATGVDGTITQGTVSQNLIQCTALNSTLFVYAFFDDADNDATFVRASTSGSANTILSTTDIDLDVGETGQVAVTSINNTYFAFAWYDSLINHINMTIRDINNNAIGSTIIVDVNASDGGTNDPRLAMATVREATPSESYNWFIIAWNDRNAGNINASVFNASGTLKHNYLLATDENTTSLLFDIYGRDDFSNFGTCDGTFLFAYTNDTGGTLAKTFYINGTEWDGVCGTVAPLDNEYPLFSSFTEVPSNNTAYSSGALYRFNATITSTNDTARFEFNSTNYTASNLTTNVFNLSVSNLAAGTYGYYWLSWGNGSNHNYNTSAMRYYTIAKASQSITPLLNGANANLVIEYPQQINSSYSGTNQTSLTININGTSIPISINITFAAGGWVVNYSAPENQNYSAFSAYLNLTINKATPLINLTLNNSENNITIFQGTSITINGTLLTGDSGNTLQLYLNGTLINNKTSPLENLTNFTNLGLYNITLIYPASQNYTQASKTFYVNVTQAPDTTPPSITQLTESPADPATYSQNQIYQFNATITDSNLQTVIIEFNNINYTPIQNGNVFSFNTTNLAAGTYNYYWQANDSAGNTNISQVQNYTISKSQSNVSLFINHSKSNITITQGTSIYLNATLITGLGNIQLYNNNTLINDNTSPITNLTNFTSLGLHNITAIYQGNQNYTASSETFYVNVTAQLDTTPPYFITIPVNATINYTQSFSASFQAQDNIALDTFTLNDTKFAINSSGFLRNATQLAAGIYIINITINDTSNNINSTIYQVTVNRALSSCTISSNSPQSYPSQINVSASCTNPEAQTSLYRDNNEVTSQNHQLITLGADTYTYIADTSQTQNYTNASASAIVTVNQNTTLALSISISPSTNVNFPAQTTATGSNCPAELTCTLQTNHTGIVANPNVATFGVELSPVQYTYNTTGNSNYSAAQSIQILTIAQNASSQISLFLNHTQANITIQNNTQININATLIIGVGIIKLFNNNSLINQGQSPLYNLTTFNVPGLYNITAIYEGNANYTPTSQTFYVNVTLPPLTDTTPPAITIISPQNTTYTNATILINISASDANINAIWFYNGTANETYISEIYRTFQQGSNTIIAYANDTSNNINSTQVTFSIDSLNPAILFAFPTESQNATLNRNYILINVSSSDANLANITIFLYNSTHTLINSSFTIISPNFINFSNLNNGVYYFNATAVDILNNKNTTETRNATINISSQLSLSLNLTCEVGGPYQQGALILVQGNLTNQTSPINNEIINLSIYKNNILNATKSVTTSSNGNYQTTFENLTTASYILNATTYQSINASCINAFQIGSQASLVLDKIATIHNISNSQIIYNITLRITNKGGSDSLNSNITDADSTNSPYLLTTLQPNTNIQVSYLLNLTRQNTTQFYLTSIATAQGIDTFSNSLITTNSTAINLTIPPASIGIQIVITKNIIFITETSLNITYNITSTLFNSGDEDLTNINYIDTDISSTALSLNLSRGSSQQLSNPIIIAKAATNTQHQFALGTATISSLNFYSNRPVINIPGYGGPADIIVHAPAAVSPSASFSSIIEIKNINPDIGQDFTLNYWITSNDETQNFSSGSQTIFISANSSINITATLTSPNTAGIYKLKASTSWPGGTATSFDTFEITSTPPISTPPVQQPSGGGTTLPRRVPPPLPQQEQNETPSAQPERIPSTPQKEEIICNLPYIRHGEECCLDENNNEICDEDETPDNFFTGFFIKNVPEIIKIKNIIIISILILIAILLILLSLHIFKKRKKKYYNRLKHIIGKKVYTISGIEIGRLEDILLSGNKISSLKIKLSKKKKFKIKRISINYKYVQGIKDIIIISEKILEKIEKWQ